MAAEPIPFKISVDQSTLDDLHLRLQETRWPDNPDGKHWDTGVNETWLKSLCHYWQHGFNWRKQEATLNQYPQFRVNIDGVNLHYLHIKSGKPNAIPLLLLHGWPDSFYRFYKLIPLLMQVQNAEVETEVFSEASPAASLGVAGDPGVLTGSLFTSTVSKARDFSYDLVIPSLPGMGFTDAINEPHQQPMRLTANLLHKLMTDVLGYQKFISVGGDGGSPLSQTLAINYPKSLAGIYISDLGWHVAGVDQSKLSKTEKQYLEKNKQYAMREGAYAMLQGTKPQTLAYSLNDSPVGLAAWITDRFYAWCDCDEDIEKSFSKDELLTNIMIYWVTGTIGSSVRNYKNEMLSPTLTPDQKVQRPVGMSLFPKDIGGIPPREFAERTLNIRHWTEMSAGGHFAAMEVPESFAEDLSNFVQTLQHAFHHQPTNI